MIHILTVHWKDDQWVDIQLKYLQEHIKEPYKVYAFLNMLPSDQSEKFHFSSTENIKSHAVKLNLLAQIAALDSSDDNDWLIFLDGDAFPIDDIVSYGTKMLKEKPLVAVQRLENNGDDQPHPCFCLTTIKFWKEIKGDWTKGVKWKNKKGHEIDDVGGRLLLRLREKNIDWHPMIRTNEHNLHNLWFGIYDNMIYHHGAGFRMPISRSDKLFESLNVFPFLKKYKYQKWLIGNKIKENQKMASEVLDKILRDSEFYKNL